ncbi:MAG TPA: SUMF1/EgtB/PvdO family nonheme iron enzyme [Thermoanaerobaculia bacterium]|nr:SUMF1/EgtB/PvdO family nonheme iron enzyme [Thermoanaerobaculia bacterium]
MNVPDTVLVSGGRLVEARLGRAISLAPFRLGRTAVTNREYSSFVELESAPEPPWWRNPEFSSPLQPVVGVSWQDADAYCRWLGRITGRRWRLPTEAEWEFAASAGLPSPKTAWGDAIPPDEIPRGALEAPWEVGRGTPNGFGLLDMGTIVHEWCSDWREEGSPGAPRRRASRGGSWRHRIRWSSPSARSSLPPDYRYSDYGFRVAREP